MLTNLSLKSARPDNQPHLLLWDSPSEAELAELAFQNNAQRVNYRTHLLSRIPQNQGGFLVLHHYVDRELEAIKSMSWGVKKPIVLLENLDCLIAYLRIQPGGQITLFWKHLEKTRKLESLLWIVIPPILKPSNWPEERVKRQ